MATAFALLATTACTGSVLARVAAVQEAINAEQDPEFDASRLPPGAQPYVQYLVKAGARCEGVGIEDVAAVIDYFSAWDPKIRKGDNLGLGGFTQKGWDAGQGRDGDGNGKLEILNGADSVLATGYRMCDIDARVRSLMAEDGDPVPKNLTDAEVLNLVVVGYFMGPDIWDKAKKGDAGAMKFDAKGMPTGKDGSKAETHLSEFATRKSGIKNPGGDKGAGPGQLPAGPVRAKIVEIAKSQVGQVEEDDKNPPTTSRENCVPRYTTRPGWCAYWCAMFASWVWTQAGVKFRTAGVIEFHNRWGATHKGSIIKKQDLNRVKPGDAVLFTRPGDYWGHVGLVITVAADAKSFTYISGNDSDAVRWTRNYPATASDIIEYVSPMVS
ncbi:CHAP domain-containing protein [Streptodolium elevatio]